MKFAHCLLPLLLPLRAVPAAADTLTDLLPPDTKVVFGIRMHNLALSSVAQTFAGQAKAATAGWLKTVPLDGIDLLRDIDEVLIASTGKGQDPPSIIVVTGRFDVPRLAEGAKDYHGVPLLTGASETDSVVALLGNGTALLGDAALVRTAIDQRGGKNRIDPALNDRLTSLRQRYDIWGLGERPEGIVSPMPETKVLESIDRFQFGMQLVNGLELAAEIHAKSPGDVEKLNGALGMIAAMVKGPQTSDNGAKFDLQVEGGTLKLALFIPDKELKKAIQSEAAILSPISTQSPTAASAPVGVTETAAPAPNGTPDVPPVAPTPAASAPVAATEMTAPAPTGTPDVPPLAPTPAAMPAAPAATRASSKPVKTRVLDKDTDTVVFTLPGKK